MNKEEVLKKYKNIELANDVWGKCRPYYTKNFIKKDDLIYIMYDVLSGETNLNNNGRKFLGSYWGFNTIAKMLLEYEESDGDFHVNFDDKNEIVEWLTNN